MNAQTAPGNQGERKLYVSPDGGAAFWFCLQGRWGESLSSYERECLKKQLSLDKTRLSLSLLLPLGNVYLDGRSVPQNFTGLHCVKNGKDFLDSLPPEPPKVVPQRWGSTNGGGLSQQDLYDELMRIDQDFKGQKDEDRPKVTNGRSDLAATAAEPKSDAWGSGI